MKLLVSPISMEEAEIVADAGTDILDIKNTNEGSLGAQFPWILKDITSKFSSKKIICSATLGDLPFKPGTAALAAYGAACCGVSYIKAGLHGMSSLHQAEEMMQGIVKAVSLKDASITVVASGYADHKTFDGIVPEMVVKAAQSSGATVAMLDTYRKDGTTLFDHLTIKELDKFIKLAHDSGLLVALAGSIRSEHLNDLYQLKPDIIGIRGIVCRDRDRKKSISSTLLKEFLSDIRKVKKEATCSQESLIQP